MANEIRVQLQLSVAKGNLSVDKKVGPILSDMAGSHFSQAVQTVGTTFEPIVIPADIATPGQAYVRNLDDTNYVRLGLAVGSVFYPFARLPAGAPALIPLEPGVDYYAEADTEACEIEVLVLEA